jgi:hypothetical protein
MLNVKWEDLSRIDCYTPMEEIFKTYCRPKFRLGDRTTYYMGEGFLLGFLNRKFRMENGNRIEYGEPGEYAIKLSFYQKLSELDAHFKLRDEQYEFEGDILGYPFEIVDGIAINSTMEEIRNKLRTQSDKGFYQEGETRALTSLQEGTFVYQNNFIICGKYQFFFFGKSKKTKLTAVEINFS